MSQLIVSKNSNELIKFSLKAIKKLSNFNTQYQKIIKLIEIAL